MGLVGDVQAAELEGILPDGGESAIGGIHLQKDGGVEIGIGAAPVELIGIVIPSHGVDGGGAVVAQLAHQLTHKGDFSGFGHIGAVAVQPTVGKDGGIEISPAVDGDGVGIHGHFAQHTELTGIQVDGGKIRNGLLIFPGVEQAVEGLIGAVVGDVAEAHDLMLTRRIQMAQVAHPLQIAVVAHIKRIVMGDLEHSALRILRGPGQHPVGGRCQIDDGAFSIHAHIVGGVVGIEVGTVDGGEVGPLTVQRQLDLINGGVSGIVRHRHQEFFTENIVKA